MKGHGLADVNSIFKEIEYSPADFFSPVFIQLWETVYTKWTADMNGLNSGRSKESDHSEE